MGHVQKRLVTGVSRLASVTPSAIPKNFPPREAFIAESTVTRPAFDPELWATLQPVPTSALSAFSHRVEDVRQACTHPSFVDAYREHYPDEKRIPKTNAQLSVLGNTLLVQKQALTAHVGPATCASVAHEIGAAPLLKWHRTPATPTKPAVLHSDALASIPRSLTALIYKKHSLLAARKFVHSYFLARQVDLRSLLRFSDPKKALSEMVYRFGREPPKSRLLKETGRYSNSPVFVVGIFSGADKLGEGYGSSLKMAEFRAAEDSLQRVFLTARPEHEIQLPSSTFPKGLGDVFKHGPEVQEGSYEPPELVAAEIRYGSAHRTTAARPPAPRK
ncbi:60S ribosomal protein L3 [Ephemerocybe angulata]|uniref:Large ribosomal subunit protein mL44 n=1 Tax=Ephemerocybe angulata TaxID=980116 RepID=A0A8H6M3A9_9AGAR|nr:60S ribosomal protein L3 [Tulosesus angulatus]